jgi:hypothetical protein
MLTRFEELGLSDVAERLRELIRPADVHDADLMSLEEAAALLKLCSPHTVVALSERGLLDGSHHDGAPHVLRASVARLLGSTVLERQGQIETQLWSLLGSD